MKVLNTRKNKMLGQGMTEYIIIVALIAIAAIGVFSMFGNVVKGQVGAMAAELGGQSGADAAKLATEKGKNANTIGSTKHDLGTFQGEARK